MRDNSRCSFWETQKLCYQFRDEGENKACGAALYSGSCFPFLRFVAVIILLILSYKHQLVIIYILIRGTGSQICIRAVTDFIKWTRHRSDVADPQLNTVYSSQSVPQFLLVNHFLIPNPPHCSRSLSQAPALFSSCRTTRCPRTFLPFLVT